MDVGADDTARVRIEENRAVHLRELEEAVGSEGDVDLEATVAKCENGLEIANADEGAVVGREYHVERNAQVSARGDHLHDVVHALNGTHESSLPLLRIVGQS